MLVNETNEITKLQSEVSSLQRKLRFNGGDNPLFNRDKILIDLIVMKEKLEYLMKSQ